MIIVIIGPSCSGKGTQATLLAKKLGVPAISLGAIFREAFRNETVLGIEAEKYWGRGEWVPDKLTHALLVGRLRQKDCKEGFVLDGHPRLAAEAITLDDFLTKQGKKVDKAFHLDISDEEAIRRMLGRRKVQQIVDKERKDDTVELMKERLENYHESIEPILVYYENKGVLVRVDGEKSIEEVNGEIRRTLGI